MPTERDLRPFPNGGEWIGVDLDSTLAHYDGWVSPTHIGEPIPLMLERVKQWLKDGKQVAIMTARVSNPKRLSETLPAIQAWCLEHLGQVLPVTHAKDYDMIELWDDRAVQVIPNTGERADGMREGKDG